MNKTWISLAFASGAAFLALALAQHYAPGLVRAVDIPVATLLSPLQTFSYVQGFLVVTTFGDVVGIVAIALGAAVLLRHHPSLVQRLIIALVGSTITTNVVKVLVSRTRPETLLWLNPFLSFSFPSGHATASMALFGFLAVASARLQQGRRHFISVALCILIILLVGLSRLALGAHFFSDVIGGWLLGLFWVALAFSFKRG
ncbi:MAG: hypothetical protein QG636_168 [Patescibacteria group bacterium]|jgi:undecaprenyl-diphosphatase|nr:hypothetical protein [Patescibacteria group bacterium]